MCFLYTVITNNDLVYRIHYVTTLKHSHSAHLLLCSNHLGNGKTKRFRLKIVPDVCFLDMVSASDSISSFSFVTCARISGKKTSTRESRASTNSASRSTVTIHRNSTLYGHRYSSVLKQCSNDSNMSSTKNDLQRCLCFNTDNERVTLLLLTVDAPEHTLGNWDQSLPLFVSACLSEKEIYRKKTAFHCRVFVFCRHKTKLADFVVTTDSSLAVSHKAITRLNCKHKQHVSQKWSHGIECKQQMATQENYHHKSTKQDLHKISPLSEREGMLRKIGNARRPNEASEFQAEQCIIC